jgi:hypothetical protein
MVLAENEVLRYPGIGLQLLVANLNVDGHHIAE